MAANDEEAPKPEPHRYRLLYIIRPAPNGFTAEELNKLNATRPDDEKFSGCDSAAMMAMLYPKDGSMSWLLIPVDGREPEPDFTMNDAEVFRAWALLAHRLAMSKTLDPAPKDICAQVHAIMVRAMTMTDEEAKGEVKKEVLPS